MRFYTVEIERGEEVFIGFPGETDLYCLADAAPEYAGMNMTEVILDLSGKGSEGGKQRAEHLFSHWQKACKNASFEVFPPEQLHLLAPIVRPRQDVICLGINYDDHAKEARSFNKEAFDKERPDTIYFSKRVNRATASGEIIPAHEDLVDSLDYEAELGVILGRDVYQISEEEAGGAIFGYTIINDISARNVQTRHKQWYLGKSLDGFTPMGPCIVTPDELGDPANLSIESFVNGELRQSSNTGNMMQTPEGAIAELSQGMTLLAGTIIATGTPAGVGMGFKPPKFLKKGDKVECRIQSIGSLWNIIG